MYSLYRLSEHCTLHFNTCVLSICMGDQLWPQGICLNPGPCHDSQLPIAQVRAKLLAAKTLLKLRSSGGGGSSSSDSSPPGPSSQQAVPGGSSKHNTQHFLNGCHVDQDAENPFSPLPMRPVLPLNCPSAPGRHHGDALSIQAAADADAGATRYHADDDYDRLCVICLEAAPAVMFQPCLHAVACAACASKVAARNNECPMCRCHVQAALPLAAFL